MNKLSKDKAKEFNIDDQVEVNETEYPINFEKGHIGLITGTGTSEGCWEIDNLHDVFRHEIKHVTTIEQSMTKIYISDRFPVEPGDYKVKFHNGYGCVLLWGGGPTSKWEREILYFEEPKVN